MNIQKKYDKLDSMTIDELIHTNLSPDPYPNLREMATVKAGILQ